jgi:hypothetical protein
MIEIGARLSGGRKATMTQAVVARWDPFANLILSHCGHEMIGNGVSFVPKQFVRHLFLPILQSGRVTRLDIDTSEVSMLHSIVFLVKVGDVVSETSDIASYAGFVWLVGDDAFVKADTEKLLSTYVLEAS